MSHKSKEISLLKAFKESKTLRNLGLLLTGNFSAQAISLLFYPLLARIYNPQDFGIFGTYSSFLVISGIFASGQLHMAFIKAENETSLGELNWLFKVFALIGTVIATLIVFSIDHIFLYFPEYLLFFFPFGLISYLFFDARKMISIREEKFKFMSQAVGLNRLVSNILKVVFGKLLINPVSLISSEILSQVASVLFLKKKFDVPTIRPPMPLKLLKKYIHFPLFATFSTFFQLGLSELPVIILAKSYSSHVIGFYVLALKILLNPLTVIGNSIGSVVSKKMVEDHASQSSSRNLLIKIYGLYFLLSIIAFSSIWLIPESWLLIILGKKWVGFKDYLLPITLLVMSKLCSGIHIYFYVAKEEMRIKSFWKALQLGTTLILIYRLSDLSFEHLLWTICGAEALLEICFVLFTLFQISSAKKNTAGI